MSESPTGAIANIEERSAGDSRRKTTPTAMRVCVRETTPAQARGRNGVRGQRAGQQLADQLVNASWSERGNPLEERADVDAEGGGPPDDHSRDQRGDDGVLHRGGARLGVESAQDSAAQRKVPFGEGYDPVGSSTESTGCHSASRAMATAANWELTSSLRRTARIWVRMVEIET